MAWSKAGLLLGNYAPVASRALTPEGTDGTSATGNAVATYARTARTLHRVTGTASAIALEYPNWYTQPNSPGEVANGNSVTIRASVEYPAGAWRQVSGSTTWNSGTAYAPLDQVVYNGQAYVALVTTTAGTAPTSALGSQWQAVTRYSVTFTGADANRRVTIPAGQTVTSLPTELNVVEGQYLAVTTTASSGSSSGTIPMDYVGSGSQDFVISYASANPAVGSADLVDKNVTTETSLPVGTRMPQPSAVLGLHRKEEKSRWVAFIGDSLIMAYGDTKVESHQKGFAVRAAEAEDIRYRRVHQGGDRMQFWTAGNAARRLPLVQGAYAILCDLGSNDISNSRTLAQLQSDAIATWTELGRKGAKVYQTTITPKTTSTDNWASLAGQTPEGGLSGAWAAGGVRDQFNDWLRNGASYVVNGQTVTAGSTGHPLTAVVDITAAIEDPGDRTKWKTNGSANGFTVDGGHPNAAGYDLLATAFRPHLKRMTTDVAKPTPASIGAADATTLGGFLPALTGPGGMASFFYRGYMAETIPHWYASSSKTWAANQVLLLLNYYGGGQAIASGSFYVTTPGTSGATATVSVYLGSSPASMAKIGSNATVDVGSVGLKKFTIGAGTPSSQGFLAMLITCTAATKPTYAASPVIPLPLSGDGGPAPVVQTGTGTTNPATLNMTTGWANAGATQLPWAAVLNG